MPTNGGSDDNGNGKVTLAVLGAKMDNVIARLDALQAIPERVTRLEERQEGDHCEIEKLRSTDRLWNAGNTLAAIVAAIIGARQ